MRVFVWCGSQKRKEKKRRKGLGGSGGIVGLEI